MSQRTKLVIIICIFASLGLVVVVATAAARFYIGGAAQQSAEMICGEKRGNTHVVTIANDRVAPEAVSARLCDKLVILNSDTARRRLAFGEHAQHRNYDGSDGRLLAQDERLTLVLSEVGRFSFHDHFDEQVHGHFTVTE